MRNIVGQRIPSSLLRDFDFTYFYIYVLFLDVKVGKCYGHLLPPDYAKNRKTKKLLSIHGLYLTWLFIYNSIFSAFIYSKLSQNETITTKQREKINDY